MTTPDPITNLHADLLVMFSAHLPEVWRYDDGSTEVGCTCGKALYVGHIIRPILNLVEADEQERREPTNGSVGGGAE